MHLYQEFRGTAENGRTDWNAIYCRLPDVASRGYTVADMRLQCLRLLHHSSSNSGGQVRGQGGAKKHKRHITITQSIQSRSTGVVPPSSHHYTL